ncbi:MAG: hypothetical protein H0U54_11850 [Acidobacteria bacterium]|nr:hypothetical protein [Acidobacteriota bacterium]
MIAFNIVPSLVRYRSPYIYDGAGRATVASRISSKTEKLNGLFAFLAIIIVAHTVDKQPQVYDDDLTKVMRDGFNSDERSDDVGTHFMTDD